jgi:prepilin-type N-terminal cleavage/methylation domain-containing protein
MNSFPRENCAARGFTLLELLVSSAILSLVLAIILGMMTTTIGLWRNTDNAIAADREGRSANLLLYDELSSAFVPHSKPALWPRVASNGTFLAFLTRKPSGYQGGAAGEIVYVEYLVESNALKRRMVGSGATYAAMLNGTTPSSALPPPQVLATNIIPAEMAMRRTLVSRTPADLAAITPYFVAVSRGWRSDDTNLITFTNRPDLSVGSVTRTNDGRYYRIIATTNILLTNSGTGDVTNRIDALANLMVNSPVYFETPAGELPQAIEVNLPATDMGTMANRSLYAGNTNMLIRNPGFFHFRATLFPSP